MSDPYAHKCSITAEKKTKHYNKKAGDPARVFPNLLLSEMQIDGQYQCIVSNMTAFFVKGVYYKLTLYMDLWNDEFVSHSLSAKRGDRMTSSVEWKMSSRSEICIRNTEWFLIWIKKRSTLPKHTMTFCRCTESHDPCPWLGHRQTMRRWRPSTAGSKQSF